MLTDRRLFIRVICCIMIVVNFFLEGCWDRKEIENRGFVLGMAIDHVETSAPKGQYDLPHVTQEAGRRKYQVTYELPRFRKTGEEKPSGGSEHYIFTGEGESMATIIRAIDAKTSFALFFEDVQIIVFSEEVAREGIGDLLDFFFRNPGMRWRVKILVTPGRAEDILKGKLHVDEVNSVFIGKITRNANVSTGFAVITNLGDIAEAIQEKRSFAAAEVVMENGDVKLTKAALFNKDKKMVGDLDEAEVMGGKIIRNVMKQGVFSIPNPANPEKLAVFEILESRIKVNSQIENNELSFTLEGDFVGNLIENTEPEQKALDPDFLAAVERAMANELIRLVQASYQKNQKLKVDALGLGSLVHRQHPEYWNTIKDRWDDEVFPAVPLNAKIKVTVRRPGMTR